MCEKLHHKNAKKGEEQKNENLMIKEDYFKRIEYCGGNDLALL